jgi:hypothetical protein
LAGAIATNHSLSSTEDPPLTCSATGQGQDRRLIERRLAAVAVSESRDCIVRLHDSTERVSASNIIHSNQRCDNHLSKRTRDLPVIKLSFFFDQPNLTTCHPHNPRHLPPALPAWSPLSLYPHHLYHTGTKQPAASLI